MSRAAETTALLAAALLVPLNNDGTTASHNLVVSRTTAAAFVADGVRGVGEYESVSGDIEVDLADMDMKVFLSRYRDPATGEEQVRIYFSIRDIDEFTGDRVEFYFDRLHNHGTVVNPLPAELTEDVAIRIPRTACSPSCSVERLTRNAFSGLFTTTTPESLDNAQVIVTSPGEYADGWTGEFALTPADLGWGYFPPVVGVMVLAKSGNPNPIPGNGGLPQPQAPWPSISGGNASAAVNWGHWKLRYPIDFSVVLDYSGSMLALDGLTQHRWDRAKRAADLFAATLGLFRDNMLADRLNVLQYSWDCFNDAPAGDKTGAVQGIASGTAFGAINPPPTGTASLTAGNNVAPPGANCTPIRKGLDTALYHLGYNAPAAKTDRVAVLLSDGFHNTPPGHVPFVPATAYNASQKSFAQVRTVAMGPDGSVGTDLLAAIATEFAGTESYVAKYNQVTDFGGLLNAYLETVQDPLAINVIDDDAPLSAGGSYNPGGPDKLVFIGVWNDPAQASNITVQHDADTPIVGTISNTKIGYAAVSVAAPPAGGTWQITATAGGVFPNQRFVLADIRIFAKFLVEQRRYQAGDPIRLQVRMRDLDRPLLGGQATVEVFRPGEGLGNVLSTIQPTCGYGKPTLPGPGTTTVPRVNAAGVASPTAVVGQPRDTTRRDPLPGRYALAAAWFARCNKSGLLRDTLPGLPLVDDGTLGDAIPGDGVWTRTYDDTGLEGSYTFRFHLKGTADDGVAYTRTRILSQYVGIEPAPEATHFTLNLGAVSGGVQSATLHLLPQDKRGNYLGPGFAGQFHLSVTAGQLVGPIVDVGNGYYRQDLRYATAGRPPRVRVGLEGTGFTTVFDPAPPFDPGRWLSWLCWLLVLVLLLLLLRRRAVRA